MSDDVNPEPTYGFRVTIYTLVIGWASSAAVFVGALAFLDRQWPMVVAAAIGSVILDTVHTRSIAADYAKWREGVGPDKTGN